jgi:hypothetical protein
MTDFSPNPTAYFRGQSLHIRNTAGKHWVVQEHSRSGAPYTKSVPKKGMNLFGRPTGAAQGLGVAARGLGHGAMNFVLQEGSWAWYTGFGGKKKQNGVVEHGYVPARMHTAVMKAATLVEVKKELSATDYARNGHGNWKTGGHSNIPYEWCHLVAHGLKGPDHEDNIVAATKFQNTEQLIIEAVLYEYRMEGLAVDVQAKLATGTAHLAESIFYEVTLDGKRAYSRTMDARRATNVSYTEFSNEAAKIRASINQALAGQYPADQADDAWLEHVDGDLVEGTTGDDYFQRIC